MECELSARKVACLVSNNKKYVNRRVYFSHAILLADTNNLSDSSMVLRGDVWDPTSTLTQRRFIEVTIKLGQ